MSYTVSDLTLEITRRCNMKCGHCLRGGAQRINMPYEIIDTVIDSIEHVPLLTVTGGEPFLNPRGIIYAFDKLRWSYYKSL